MTGGVKSTIWARAADALVTVKSTAPDFNPLITSATSRYSTSSRAVRVVTGLYILLAHRVTCIGRGNIPADGPVIFAPNHASNIDHFFLGAYTNRKVQFMAKSQLFSGPLAWIYKHGGVFPVRRGHHDEQSFAVARSILERGGAVCTYCEGGRSRTGLLPIGPSRASGA